MYSFRLRESSITHAGKIFVSKHFSLLTRKNIVYCFLILFISHTFNISHDYIQTLRFGYIELLFSNLNLISYSHIVNTLLVLSHLLLLLLLFILFTYLLICRSYVTPSFLLIYPTFLWIKRPPPSPNTCTIRRCPFRL